MRRAAACATVIAVALAASAAGARAMTSAANEQIAAAAPDPARGETEIAGRPVSCKDIHGRAVHTMRVANLGDVGRAGIVNRIPVIALDPEILGRLPDKLALFFYQHECAHHVLGHWFQMSLNMETEADCWAIRHGRDNGTLSRDDVMSFAPFLANSGGSAFGHLPGPERAKYLLNCFDAH